MCRHPYDAHWDERRDERCQRLAGRGRGPTRGGALWVQDNVSSLVGPPVKRLVRHTYFRAGDTAAGDSDGDVNGDGEDGREGRAPFPRLIVQFKLGSNISSSTSKR